MDHPLLSQAQGLRDGPARPDDRCAPEDGPALPCYRSEAFAEDLVVDAGPVIVRRPSPARTPLRAPVLLAVLAVVGLGRAPT